MFIYVVCQKDIGQIGKVCDTSYLNLISKIMFQYELVKCVLR